MGLESAGAGLQSSDSCSVGVDEAIGVAGASSTPELAAMAGSTAPQGEMHFDAEQPADAPERSEEEMTRIHARNA